MFIPVQSSLERDPDTEEHPDIVSIYSNWLKCADGRWAPAWKDVDVMSLPSRVLPYVAVCDVADDEEFVYRYWGRGHTGYHRADYSKKRISDITPSWVRDFLHHQYMRVVESRRPLLFETRYDFHEMPVLTIRMPLSDDGENVTGVLSVSDKTNVANELRHWICLPTQTVLKPA